MKEQWWYLRRVSIRNEVPLEEETKLPLESLGSFQKLWISLRIFWRLPAGSKDLIPRQYLVLHIKYQRILIANEKD